MNDATSADRENEYCKAEEKIVLKRPNNDTAEDLGVSASSPLPRGWHRIVWDQANATRYVVTDDVVSLAFLEGILVTSTKASNIRFESWSDNYNGERS